MTKLPWRFDDGGRSKSSHAQKKAAGDCVVRSIVIASRLPYDEVWTAINKHQRTREERRFQYLGLDMRGFVPSTPDTGVHGDDYSENGYLQSLGSYGYPLCLLGRAAKCTWLLVNSLWAG
jgi:hypothetical protein